MVYFPTTTCRCSALGVETVSHATVPTIIRPLVHGVIRICSYIFAWCNRYAVMQHIYGVRRTQGGGELASFAQPVANRILAIPSTSTLSLCTGVREKEPGWYFLVCWHGRIPTQPTVYPSGRSMLQPCYNRVCNNGICRTWLQGDEYNSLHLTAIELLPFLLELLRWALGAR